MLLPFKKGSFAEMRMLTAKSFLHARVFTSKIAFLYAVNLNP